MNVQQVGVSSFHCAIVGESPRSAWLATLDRQKLTCIHGTEKAQWLKLTKVAFRCHHKPWVVVFRSLFAPRLVVIGKFRMTSQLQFVSESQARILNVVLEFQVVLTHGKSHPSNWGGDTSAYARHCPCYEVATIK